MNPRNSAAGAIRQLDPQIAADAPAVAVGATAWARWRESPSSATAEALDWLREHRFPVNPEIEVADDVAEVVEDLPSLAGAARHAGLRDRRRRRQGQRLRAPAPPRRGRARAARAIAWKFPPTTAVTKLVKVALERRAHGRPASRSRCSSRCRSSGVTVKLATLHNEEDLARKDVREGDDVIVLRAGDVIPQVISPAPRRGQAQGRASAAPSRRRSARSAPRRRSRPRARCSPAARTASAPGASGSCSRTSRPRARWTSRASARSRSRS